MPKKVFYGRTTQNYSSEPHKTSLLLKTSLPSDLWVLAPLKMVTDWLLLWLLLLRLVVLTDEVEELEELDGGERLLASDKLPLLKAELLRFFWCCENCCCCWCCCCCCCWAMADATAGNIRGLNGWWCWAKRRELEKSPWLRFDCCCCCW